LVPEIGSVGASGDRVELAHVARAVAGEGPVERDGRRQTAAAALAEAGLSALVLEGREALAMMNGTSCEAAQAALVVVGAQRLVGAAGVAGAPVPGVFRADAPGLHGRGRRGP